MKKDDLIALADEIREKAQSDYYGKEPSTENVLRDLNYKLKPVLTYKEWREEIETVVDSCMRMGAALGSWTRLDNENCKRMVTAGFTEIRKEAVSIIIAAVSHEHDEERPT